jgi:hypothetical protein
MGSSAFRAVCAAVSFGMIDNSLPKNEPGADERFERGIAKALRTPPKPHKTPSAKDIAAQVRFEAGWSDGWKAICGPDASVPPLRGRTVPSGFDAYQYGYNQGRAIAGGK